RPPREDARVPERFAARDQRLGARALRLLDELGGPGAPPVRAGQRRAQANVAVARLGVRRHDADGDQRRAALRDLARQAEIATEGRRDARNRLLQQAPPPAQCEQLLRRVDPAAGPEPGPRTARHDDRVAWKVWHDEYAGRCPRHVRRRPAKSKFRLLTRRAIAAVLAAWRRSRASVCCSSSAPSRRARSSTCAPTRGRRATAGAIRPPAPRTR